ncbi:MULTISPECIES: hypothetical protein [Roseovarius]|uniref:hypothetical protein n=1 Tax=Roseovarius TaxID=74030 RepID=UPI001C969C62|nr:hypothetical protein [Roseovarius atlanticus]MBY5989197.1 hypothetical protein [Roseovarius atlanticus]MBY6124589.1 hypothetical protein [Roseovarius atlanticus]MBY6149084.1 hypothetical protein [Roseovarius atlanticus]
MTHILSGRGARTLVLALMAGAMLAGCARNSERVTFNGVFYKQKSKAASKDNRQLFVVTVPRVDRGYDGALAAGAYEGKRYCVQNFGTSEIEWYRSPLAPRGTVQPDGNKLTFTGKCVLW